MEGNEEFLEENIQGHSLRLALTEINKHIAGTPISTNPDEMIIIQRGPRKKPITWSPVEYSRTKILLPSRDKTPEPIIQKSEINPRVRRRLVLSPSKDPSPQMSLIIFKKLGALMNIERSVDQD